MAKGSCPTCHWYRKPVPVTLFSPDDLTNPEVQKVNHEVYEWHRQRLLDEDQRIANKMLFEHKPKNFAWCAGHTAEINKYFTRQDAQTFRDKLLRGAESAREFFNEVVVAGQDLKKAAKAGDSQAGERLEEIRRNRTDPVSGEIISYYVPVKYVNDDGGCDDWEKPRERGTKGAAQETS
jgi:hypothetical protein